MRVARHHRLLNFFVLSFLAHFISNCGGISSAVDTQASLPIPDNSGITISSPNSEGYVVVTGSQAVPSNAIVIVNVDSATSFNFLPMSLASAWNALIPSAQAFECTASQPTCPDLNENGECKYTASTDGSFTLQIPANVSDRISISYLDPSSCTEVSVFEDAFVSNDTPYLDFLGYGMDLDSDNGMLYLTGIDTNAQGVVKVMDVTTHEIISTSTDPDFIPEEIHVFHDDNSGYFISLTDMSTHKISPLDETTGDVSALNFYTLADESGTALPNLTYLTSSGFATAVSSSCTTVPDSTNPMYTRSFFTDGSVVYFHEFQSSLDNADPNNLTTLDNGDNGILLNPLSFSFSDDASATVSSVNYMKFDIQKLHIVLGVTSPNLPDYPNPSYYYFVQDMAGDYCSGSMTLALNDGISMGTVEDEIHFAYGIWPISGSDTTVLAALRSSTNQHDLFVFENEDIQDYTYVDFDSTHSEAVVENFVNGTLSDSTTLSTSNLTGDVSLLAGVTRPNTNLTDFAIISPYYRGSTFFNEAEISDSNYGLDTPLYALYPLAMQYDSTNDQLLVLDIGLSSTENENTFGLYTLVRFYELNP